MTGNRSELVERAILDRLREDDGTPYTQGFNNGVRAANVVANQALAAPNQPLSDSVVERLAREVVMRSPPAPYPYNLYIPVTDAVRTALAAIPSAGGVETEESLGASPGSRPSDQAPTGLGGSRFDPARMTMFLEILSAAGGEADASESSWNWINAFLEEHEKRYPDTFNEAIDAGYVDWSHDSDSDHSTIRLTTTGRAALGGGQ